MEEDDKECLMIRLGVSGWVSSGTGLPGLSRTKAVKRLCVCVCVCVCVWLWLWLWLWLTVNVNVTVTVSHSGSVKSHSVAWVAFMPRILCLCRFNQWARGIMSLTFPSVCAPGPCMHAPGWLCLPRWRHSQLACCRLLVCVCLSQVGVLLKRLNRGSHKQHHTISQGL